ncbi:helix-turn-helix domain-containing protein [Sphingobacterium sp. SYP-B4668]|uniref:helix-turn-helix domain-containing protein n=1 Tax=Sphingobacterium sp. SYP-B4668 TaxID=2996035 RepID=UPI0022DCF028|nr:XRE family transcriptional regulator [Sphingobacterium sp. SYP-B4668]
MKSNTIFKISSRIREIRKGQGITLHELGERAGVSKGLLSQIENNRTVPSLLVLINIINSLGINLNDFFKGFTSEGDLDPIIVCRKEEYEKFEKEHAVGFSYQRIFTTSIASSTMDVVLLELEPDATRPMVTTEAFEYKYILAGEVEYIFQDKKVQLHEGDSILFDGRQSHTPRNIGSKIARMLIIYFFEQEKA